MKKPPHLGAFVYRVEGYDAATMPPALSTSLN